MRIRSILFIAFLLVAFVPPAIFAAWSYRDGVNREFAEIADRHLLIAQNLSITLERYHTDLTATFETIADSMMAAQTLPNTERLMQRLQMIRVEIIDPKHGAILARTDPELTPQLEFVPAEILRLANALAATSKTVFSPVLAGPDGENEMLVLRRYGERGERIAVGRIRTDYFVRLGKSVAFGVNGHATIVDQAGNVLAHPLPTWVAARKNIAKISSVRRMMNGETGIEQFYSPALKDDMIAGLTHVPGPGWGVMVPQPVSEIYDKVASNKLSVFVALAVGLSIALVFVFILIRSMASPLENLVSAMRQNARNRLLSKADVRPGMIAVKELSEFRDSYNKMVEKVSAATDHIERLAYTDSVTGMPNRERFKVAAGRALEQCSKTGTKGILFLIDIDNFKEINDAHGHDAGDKFLRSCAAKLDLVADRQMNRLKNQPGGRPVVTPTIARIGGDEFMMLVPGLVDDSDVELFLQDMKQELCSPADNIDFVSDCSASIGCARFPEDGEILSDLMKRADIATFHAKKSGKNQSAIFTSHISMQTTAEIRMEFAAAVEEDQLLLEYQPKICAERLIVEGVEALVRWEHPTRGRMRPDLWIPAISSSPSIALLGEWVIERAMRDHGTWTDAGHDLRVSINVGSRHFVSENFIEKLVTAARRNNFDPRRFEIEVTEDAFLAAEERAEAAIRKLHDLNFTVSIDDFGKGYSNIARLAQMKVDYLKIDRSITTGSLDDPRVRAILSSTVAMATALGCKTVAEGVETLEQVEFVSNLGVDMLQGYYFSKPLPPQALLPWLNEGKYNTVHHYQDALQAIIAS